MFESDRGKIVFEAVGLIAMAVAALIFISLASFDPTDPSLNTYISGASQVSNKVGIVGATVADALVQFGGATAWLIALMIVAVGVGAFSRAPILRWLGFFVCVSVALAAVAGLIHLRAQVDPLFKTRVAGGLLGAIIADRLTTPWIGRLGGAIFLSALTLSAIMLAARLSISSIARKSYSGFYWLYRIFGSLIRAIARFIRPIGRSMNFRWRPPWPSGRLSIGRMKFWGDRSDHLLERLQEHDERIIALTRSRSIGDSSIDDLDYFSSGIHSSIDDFDDVDPDQIVMIDSAPDEKELRSDEPEEAPAVIDAGSGEGGPAENAITIKKLSRADRPKSAGRGEQESIFADSTRAAGKRFKLPRLDLLDINDQPPVDPDDADLIKASRVLESKLADFGVQGRVTQVRPGPVITTYEFEPAPGVKVARIVSLADDLAMSLRALSVRIEAPIPGKSVVGIEAPNAERATVLLSDIISSDQFQKSSAALPLALGKDALGSPVVADLARIPHLLIAGSTGSGKSVGAHAMISSILFRRSPDEVKFIMIDPKMLELSSYDGIPHLITPVVTRPKRATSALKWAVKEMERRYTILAAVGARGIESYNKLVDRNLKRSPRPSAPEDEESRPLTKETVTEKLPFIVIVIDELADLMMVSSKEVEDSLARLAQMARAAGIHLIVATQRPSVDVLTGLIKANFPARISYQVRSRVDSRTILDSMGAERLLGRGDMLFLAAGSSFATRIQAPFVSDEEVENLVGFIKGQAAPEYNEALISSAEESQSGGDDDGDEELDELYDKAIEIVADSDQASVSMIQRRLRIGYNRAARMVERMEKDAIVGPADGARPREVYLKRSDSSSAPNV